MNKKDKTIFFMLILCSLIFSSCFVTTLDTAWKDPQYQGGKITKILIIGVAKRQTTRKLFEDEFAAKLQNHGTEAMSSYRIIPSTEKLDKSLVASKIKELDIDGVLVSRLVDTKVKTNYKPGVMGNDWYGFYSRSYVYASSMTSYETYEVLKIETNLYSTQTGEVIWSALSDTITGGTIEVELKSIIDVITKSLLKNELI